MDWINDFLIEQFYMSEFLARSVLIGLMIVCIVFVLLRVLVTYYYQFSRSMVKMSQKEVKSVSEFKSTKSVVLNKIIGDFMELGEKGIGNINTESIAKKHLSGVNFLFINLQSLCEMIKIFEISIVFIGLIFAVVFDYPQVFAVVSISAFLVFRLFAVIFNFDLMYNNLLYEITHYVNKEFGKFYIGDFSSAIQRLKVELVVALSSQSNIISVAMDDFGRKASESMKKSMSEIADSVNLTMESLSNFGTVLEEPLEKWKQAITEASKNQDGFNEVFGHMGNIVENFRDSSAVLTSAINSFISESESSKNIASEQIGVLSNIANSLIKNQDTILEITNAMENQLKYLNQNQDALKTSLESYEGSIQQITVKTGDAFGSIVSHHIQESYFNLNDDLKNNIHQISAANKEVMEQIVTLVEKIEEQNKNIIQGMVNSDLNRN